MAGKRTDAGLQRVAERVGCDVAAVKAVIDVESAGAGFRDDGRPKILFESHIFSRMTGGRFDKTHPTLSSPGPRRELYKLDQYDRLYQALQLNGEIAVQSCSWGLMQIMGFNWAGCGEQSLYGFLAAMHHNEDAQLALFAGLVVERGWHRALQKHDWAEFARQYNGVGYAANHYDEKLADAYARATNGR
jgi:hypothetical protein